MLGVLLRQRRFLALFCCQFLGAFNDNLFKNALVILITYTLMSDAGDAAAMVALAGGVFILPFFLFSATAGQLADKYEKSRLIRCIKAAEIFIMGLGGLGFVLNDVNLLMFTLFLLGTQSAFFGPLKYSIIPELLTDNELVSGNALIEASTFVSILLGTIVGGVVIVFDAGPLWITRCGLCVAIAGLVASFYIPVAKVGQPHLVLSANVPAVTWRIIQFARQDRRVFLSIVGISWFWLVGAAFLAQFPGFTKEVVGAHAYVVTLFLSLFSIGIGTGSLICERLLKGQINATYVPVGIFGISIFVADLYFASRGMAGQTELMSLATFIASPAHWRIMLDIFMIALCGGLYVVPLYAIVQYHANPKRRSRIIAANNIINALFMAVSAGLLALLLRYDVRIPSLFLIISVLNSVVAMVSCRLLPSTVVKSMFKAVLRLFYRVQVHGLAHYPKVPGQSIVIANHVSFLDGLLLDAFLPESYVFAIDKQMATVKWLKPLLKWVDAFEIDPRHPLSLKALIRELKQGRSCIIFPEGRLTKTGALMKVYEGPGVLADKTGHWLVPVRIEGAEHTAFTRLRGRVRRRWLAKVSLHVLAPERLTAPSTLSARARRQQLATQLYDRMTRLMVLSSARDEPLFLSLLKARKAHGRQTVVLEDITRSTLSYQQLLVRVTVLARVLRAHALPGEFIGVLLPNMNAAVITFFALQCNQQVPALLNYTTGAGPLIAACKSACVRRMITSKQFVERAQLSHVIQACERESVTVIYLEDVGAALTRGDKWVGWMQAHLPTAFWQRRWRPGVGDTPAVILFTSGSEGTPKGVMLSHQNIQTNRYQLASQLDFNAQDVAFSALPLFHAFGLGVGLLLPVLEGIKTFLYPSPLHYRIIPELIYALDATLLFGTDSFLAGYANAAHPYDFYSLRYVFAGAEKLKPTTREHYAHKFGVRIFEGYGATETSPVLSINTPMYHRPDSVGRLLPGIDYRLQPVAGIAQGQQLLVRGDNVMMGYLTQEKPGVLQPLTDGWYDTGDIVERDADGYFYIIGRVKRFAKIAGEMISLAAIETALQQCWPERQHAVVSIPDAKKGEHVALLTEAVDCTRERIVAAFKAQGLTTLFVPEHIKLIAQVPLLGSGKIDYKAVSALFN